MKDTPADILFDMNRLTLPITLGEVDTLLKIGAKNPNSIILYMYLLRLFMERKNVLIYCTKQMIHKEFGWGFTKIKTAKKVLVENKIIKNITRRDDKNNIIFYAIQLSKPRELTRGRYSAPLGVENTVKKAVDAHVLYNEGGGRYSDRGGSLFRPYNNIPTVYNNTKGVCSSHTLPFSKKNSTGSLKKKGRTKYPVQKNNTPSTTETDKLKLKYPLVKTKHLKFAKRVLKEINKYYPYSCNDISSTDLIYRNADALRKIENKTSAEFMSNFRLALMWFPSSTHFWRSNLRCIATLTKKSTTTSIPKFEYLTSEYIKSNPVPENINIPFSEKEINVLVHDFSIKSATGINVLRKSVLDIIQIFKNIPSKQIRDNDIFKSRFPSSKSFVRDYINYLHEQTWLTLSVALLDTDNKVFNTWLYKISDECMIRIKGTS